MEDKDFLETQFTEEEVMAAIRGMSGDKAPGPDGFPLAFFQNCWEVIKDDLIEVFQHFYVHKSFERSFNASFIALIPKRVGAEDITEFRPIW